jgi:hypothetical protein
VAATPIDSDGDGEAEFTVRRGQVRYEVEWEAEIRSLYDSMARIGVEPTWAKLIDFEETLPTPVEELIRRRQDRQHS